ncbi:SDR family oxidoreductase [Hahella aquimaris]|uniref:SDR family NAD(P)-dependent oxidoreductase n=1 Tax=Hahella sp. HNIBRBA332 TaxID=3015983 RepID=UPI00273AD388|nr:SDR family oxidoreductase [Hahella sp. HNIBRBA332]WLQ15602.1 SDR family oxidoreductase [Hahella sp. HNIBRBA332]
MNNSINNRKTVLITGASSGIGESFAKVFAEKGFDTLLIARRKERLEKLAQELTAAHGNVNLTLALDLNETDAIQKVASFLKKRRLHVDALVNNAGYALPKPFMVGSWDEHKAMINLLITVPTALCHLVAEGMKEHGQGWIINVSSIAAFAPEFPGSLYNAAKSYVLHMTEALDLELRPFNINCMSLCPGLTSSEFHETMGVKEFLSYIPKWRWMESDIVAKEGYEGVMRGEHLLINGKVNRALVNAFKFMPNKIKYLMGKKQIIL